jgi:hypothetical protein
MKKIPLLIILAGVIAVACSKDKDTGNQSIYGKWRVVEPEYANFSMVLNENGRYHFLYDQDNGFRSMESDSFLLSEDYIEFFSHLPVYSYTVDDNYLTLKSKGKTEYVCIKDKTVADPDVWIKPLEIESSVEAPNSGSTDFSAGSKSIWYCGYYFEKQIGSYSNPHMNLQQVYATEYEADAVEMESDNYLWYSQKNKLIRINVLNGIADFASSEFPGWIKGIAWDGECLWCGLTLFGGDGSVETALAKYNPKTDNIISQVYFGDIGDIYLAYANDRLYISCQGFIHEYSPDSKKVLDVYGIENNKAFGLAYDGNDFLVSGYGLNEDNDYGQFIYSVSMPAD